MTPDLALIVHNIRSAHNVGSILRSADCFAVNKVYLTGYTPYPAHKGDSRLPHLSEKIDRQITKTALGAEKTVNWQSQTDVISLINQLRLAGYQINALEQATNSIAIEQFEFATKAAVIVGREVEGIEPEILKLVDNIIEIGVKGSKVSLNVSVAAAIAMYQARLKR
jgi:23S rRNA (guanosine2251-2'-O)-methyltransferase